MSKVVDVTLRLVDRMTAPLNAVGGSLANNAKQWAKAGRQITNVGSKITKTGNAMTKDVTVPVLGTGAAAVKVAADFEKGMSNVQSVCGASGKQMDNLAEKAKEMGRKTKFSATEATEAFKYMAMAGWNTKQMKAGIEGVMYLAGATGEDLASTSDIVTDALTAFGMKANETNRFVNVLAQAANRSNTDVGKMGETFKYVAPVAGALGYNIEDTSVAIGLMANNGIKASSAGTSLRSWMSRMSAPSKETAGAMEKLGISMTDSSGKMKSLDTLMRETRDSFSGLTKAQKSQYASILAGKNGMSGLLAIVNSSDSDFNKLTKAINNSDGACKKMYKTAQNNLVGQLTTLKSKVESIGIAFGERMTPYVKKVTEWVGKAADKFAALSTKQQDMIVRVALVVAAIGPALVIFGTMTKTIGGVVKAVGNVGKAFKMFKTVAGLVATPAGTVIAVLVALIAAGVLVYKNWDKIQESAKRVFGVVRKVFNDCGASGKQMRRNLEPVGKKFVEIKENVSNLYKSAKPYIDGLGEAVRFVFVGVIGSGIGAAVSTVSTFAKAAVEYIGNVMTAFNGVITFLNGVFTGNWKKAWIGVKDIFKGVFGSLVTLAKTPINAIIGLINGMISGINRIGVKIPKWVPKVGGKNFSINIPKIPQLAKGTQNWRGGIVQINEHGGEIVDLPSGSRVYPHDASVKKAYQEGKSRSTKNITIAKIADTIIVREEADIDKIAERLARKLEKTADNLGGEELGYIY